ncbi:leucyl/phenylalanyl-tRNA--protein transferase [Nitrogeniibacter mangrovi]|uniref:Leucyl/phenylalanyl-tRNA--protein transferase n=1 Tax=Nitrogeniibacter mangrovi TaxID=2016596 RepID=A0A6C1B544_9RHOO|nr:leucyl/phenylalanyl-tRNA--protein transferase [Nitrogeniibacter mangrovi]QID18129.1 leucyl/phenylalanyl-tRNA--protein transferase [Nitrogeniibacter mangrovi]
MIPWLTEPDFPPTERALTEPNGLLAAGGALTPEWLLAAYRRGIFPWFSEGEPILWWSPDPRMILRPGEVKVSRSLGKTLRQGRFEVRYDTAFAEVIHACGQLRAQSTGTWITPHMELAYRRLHELGHAHSVETWQDGRLVGGLYGVALDRAFFGESMFSLVSDASKVALVHLCRRLERLGFGVIDCQMATDHLRSMGGVDVPRAQFVRALDRLIGPKSPPQRWPASDDIG